MTNLDYSAYLSFMLRLWQVKDATGPVWHASLESVETGRLQGFASLEELLTYLNQITREENLKPGKGSHIEVQG
jgi:hypothetical protein